MFLRGVAQETPGCSAQPGAHEKPLGVIQCVATAWLFLAMVTCHVGLSVALVWLFAAFDSRMAGTVDLHDPGVDR